MTKENEQVLTGLMREQYLVEWIFLIILWVVSGLSAYILSVNILLLPQYGPPWTPTPDITPFEWLFLAMHHPSVWPPALATLIALTLTVSLTIYFTIRLPPKVDSILRLELSRIGITRKRPLRREYITQINSKGILTSRLLPKISGSGEYGLVILRARLPEVSTDQLHNLAQRYFLAFHTDTLTSVSSLDELHFKITQLARALDDL